MKNDPHIGQLFSAEEEPCPSLEEMQSYAAGKLPSVERHAFERHLLNCELCSFAYEGLAGEDPAVVEASVAAITEEAWNRVGQREKRKRRGVYMWMSGAAAILLLIVVGYFVTSGPGNEDHLQGLADAMLEESGDMDNATSERGDVEGEMDYADGSAPATPPLEESKDAVFRNEGLKDLEANGNIVETPVEVYDEIVGEGLVVEEEPAYERPDQSPKLDAGPPNGNAGWYSGISKDAPGKKEESGNFAAGDGNAVTTIIPTDPASEIVTRSSVTPVAPTINQQGTIANNGVKIAADSMSVYTYNSTPSINQALNDKDALFAMDKEQEKKMNTEDMGGGEFGFAGSDDFGDDLDDGFAEEEAEETLAEVQEDASADPADQPALVEKTVSSTDRFNNNEFESMDNTVGGVTTGSNTVVDEVVAADVPASVRDRRNSDSKLAKGKAKAPAKNRSLEMADSKTGEYKDFQKSSYEQGVEQFQRKDYREAAANLRQAAADTPDNLNAHLLAAKSFLQLKQPNAAIYHLDRILATPNNSLEEDAKWYKSIALLQLGKKKDAQKLLENVESSGGNRSKAAKKALNKL